MAEIKILSSTQVRPPIDFVTGRLAAATRVVGVVPTREHAVLVAGSQYLQLPEWSVEGGGPMVFQVEGDGGGGSVLTGMGGVSTIEVTEFSLLGALILIICNVAAVSTSADDSDSPEGSRFSASVQINPGFAQLFICASVAGEKKWFPIGFATPSP